MKNPFKNLRYHFSLQSAIDEGFAYERKKPIKLSPEKKKELLESSSLETPRSNIRAIVGVLKPYLTESSKKERLFAATLLSGSLLLNYFSVDMMADFGNWLGTMTNTVAQLWGIVSQSRPDIIADIINQYPMVQDALQNIPLASEMMTYYPDVSQMQYDPAFRDLITNNPGFADVLQRNPTMEDLFMQHPDFARAVEANPELLDQLGEFRDDMGSRLNKLPAVQQKLSDLVYICGGAFVENSWNFLTTAFNSVVHDNSVGKMFTETNLWEFLKNPAAEFTGEADNIKGPLNTDASAALSKWWGSKDMATIALKFTAAAVASYKATQFLVLRWRSWSTGYFTKKWTTDNAWARVKSDFNNIDNPGQRIQEDPGHFAGASVSLLTGVTRSAMTLSRFSGMLWGMGPVLGVVGGFFWIGAAYCATLTALTYGVARRLPSIYRNKQRVEANLRRSTDNIHNNAEQIALTENAESERELVKKRVTPVMKNATDEIGTQVKMIALNATVGNVSIPLPYVVASFTAVAAGTASFGTIQTLNYAFNQVNSSLSFIIDRFEQISAWMATAQRMYSMDQAIDAAHYLEEEKRLANEQLGKEEDAGGNIPPAPEGP